MTVLTSHSVVLVQVMMIQISFLVHNMQQDAICNNLFGRVKCYCYEFCMREIVWNSLQQILTTSHRTQQQYIAVVQVLCVACFCIGNMAFDVVVCSVKTPISPTSSVALGSSLHHQFKYCSGRYPCVTSGQFTWLAAANCSLFEIKQIVHLLDCFQSRVGVAKTTRG